ncbi:MAG: TSUP family transporter, partial [Gaiellaceae bacterium]
MSATTVLLAVLLGFAAGLAAGFFGVGGGILFVPTLVALGLSQLEAEATSLLAILPTVAAGLWRQQRYGNTRWRASLVLG